MLNSIRIILTDTPVLTIPTDHLLFGSEHLSVDKNTRLFNAVLSSSVNPNALVINHSYCQVDCLPIWVFSLLYIFLSKLNYVSPTCIVMFSVIYCNSTLSGDHKHYQAICTYITLCKVRQESIYISPWLSIHSLVIYIWVLSRCICKYFLIRNMFKPTIVMFPDYVNAEFRKRRMLQFKGCRRRVSRNNCKRTLL